MKGLNMFDEDEIARERFRFYFLIFRNVGVSLISRNNSKAYMLFSAIMVFCGYSMLVAVILDLLKHKENLQHTMQNVHAVAGILCTLWIHLCFRLEKDRIVKLMTLTNAFTWEDLPTTSTKGETTMAAMIPRIQKTVKQMLISVMAFHGSYIVVRLVNSEQRVLTANSFYLFDVSSSPVYEVILLSQIMAAAFYMVLFFGMWGLYATLVCIACSQLEKLRANLLDIRQEYETQEQDSGAETDTEEEEIQVHTSQEVFRRMQGELKDCVRHHQQILRFMKAMEDTLHPVLLGLFFIATGCICLSGFSVVMNWGEVMPMSQAALIYFAMMFFLFAFCRLGEELTHQVSAECCSLKSGYHSFGPTYCLILNGRFKMAAKSVRDAVWESNWVGAPVPFQHSLIIINIIASKKFSLTAGKFVPVSNKTMLSIFNQTISFFMFLLKVKEETDHTDHS